MWTLLSSNTKLFFYSFISYQDKMIPCFVEIFETGKYENWHSKSITKPKYKLTPDLALQQFFWTVHFVLKKKLCPLSLKGHLGNLCSPPGGWATTITVQGYFCGFCNFLLFITTQVPVSAQNPPTITLPGNWWSSASKIQRVPSYNFKDNGQSYFL